MDGPEGDEDDRMAEANRGQRGIPIMSEAMKKTIPNRKIGEFHVNLNHKVEFVEKPSLPKQGDSYSIKSHTEMIEEKRNAIFKLENEYQDLCLASETLNNQRMVLLEKMNKAKGDYVNFCSQGFKYP